MPPSAARPLAARRAVRAAPPLRFTTPKCSRARRPSYERRKGARRSRRGGGEFIERIYKMVSAMSGATVFGTRLSPLPIAQEILNVERDDNQRQRTRKEDRHSRRRRGDRILCRKRRREPGHRRQYLQRPCDESFARYAVGFRRYRTRTRFIPICF